MPRKKINKERIGQPIPPKHWDPEQFFYRDAEKNIRISMSNLDAPPAIYTRYVDFVSDITRIDQWKNKCNLKGSCGEWHKTIDIAFIDILDMDVELQKEYYKIFRESMQAKLGLALKNLKIILKKVTCQIKDIEDHLVPRLFPLLEYNKNQIKYIEDLILMYDGYLIKLTGTKSNYYAFLKPFIKKLISKLDEEGITKQIDKQKIVLQLFKIFKYSDFNKINQHSALERIRSSFF
jgi:hypothetical protein